MKKNIFLALLFCLVLSSCSIGAPLSSQTSSEETSSSEEFSSIEASSSEEISSEIISSEEISSEEESSSEETSSEEESSSEEISSSEEESSTPLPYTGYYEDINPTYTGNALLSQVRELIVTTHSTFTKYGDSRGGTSGRSDETDYDPNNKTNLIMFYTHASIDGTWDAGKTYNREHVWPQSLSNGLWGEKYGGADMHHIRPCFSGVNSARGNKEYGYVEGGTLKTYSYNGATYDAGYYNADYYEPLDFTKGDVARIILYLFVRYNTIANLNKNNINNSGLLCFTESEGCGDLPITNVIKGTKENAFKTLLEWHELDPVDELELNRNEGVYKIQGNRNPFIDHPEMVANIWG